MKIYKNIILPTFLILFCFSCNDTRINVKPKVLGTKGISLDVKDTASSDTFKFNFAYRDSSAAAPLNTFIYLQGAANTKTTMNATCNAAGTNCICEFLTSNSISALVHSSTAAQISYDSTGNYFRCQYTGATPIASITYVRLRNLGSTGISSIYQVKTSLTAAEILGDELSMNKLRSISRYYCQYNFLQKAGTTTTSFDCSTQATACSTAAAKDFCLLTTSYPYYLYSDNLSSNLTDKMSDKIYNGATDNKICDLQIKQIDCTGAAGVPSNQFGLYSEQIGVFQTPVSLAPKPEYPTTTYGYAAATSTFLGNTVCPPGLTPVIFYRATPNAAAITPSHNIPTTLTASEISSTTTTPTAISFVKLYDGDCNGTVCDKVPDTVAPDQPASTAYSSTGETAFCVIPSALLP